ncbi:MAG: 6-pyruvoyl-tetrahydropterin synthase [Polaribacter sp.]|jgi:6-pyruvoyl-tetrahydropterin synthase
MPVLFVNNLSVIDFAYFCPIRGIVGESLILDVELFGELNEEGMLFDFSYVKKRIKSCVDSLVDHKLLVATKSEYVKISNSPQQLELELITKDARIFRHTSPNQAVCLINASEVSKNSIAELIRIEISKILPNNVSKTQIGLRSEVIKTPFFHYAHGLKKHFGDCQRIAHGHRSKIEVFVDSNYSDEWSMHIAQLWKDVYLATEEDIKEDISINGIGYWVFEYHANQGLFQLTIQKSCCHLIETDTTVELIASYLADYLKKELPNNHIRIKAYEGVDKGAVSERC